MDVLKGYKTVIFFGLAFVIAVANLLGFGSFQLSKDQLEIINLVVPVIGLVLRYVTTSEIFKS